MNARGLSPLVATVLLIAFSVALGAVVMSYGETYVEQQADFVSHGTEVSATACDGVSLSVIKVKNIAQLCSRDSVIDVALDNGGVTIDSMQARIFGSAGVSLVSNMLQKPLSANVPLKTTFAYDPVGVPLQVKLTPAVLTPNGVAYCSDAAVTIDDVKPC